MRFEGTVYVDRPDNVDHAKLVDRMLKTRHFKTLAIHNQAGDELAGPMDGSTSRLVDHARSRDVQCALWVTLDLDHSFDLGNAGTLTKHLVANGAWDGIVINAEAIAPHLDEYLDALEPLTGRHLAWSTLPTFEMGEAARRLDRAGAWLHQQAYVIENGVSVQQAIMWANRPPLWEGWWYRAKVLGRSVRGKITGQDFRGYTFKENGNTWGLRPSDRKLFNRKRLNDVGGLLGLWAPNRITPTIRTTPNAAGGFPAGIDPETARMDVKSAGDPAVGLYLGETTPNLFWDTYR